MESASEPQAEESSLSPNSRSEEANLVKNSDPRHHMTLLILKFIVSLRVPRAIAASMPSLQFNMRRLLLSIASRMQRFQAYTLLAPYYMYKRMLMLLRPPSHLLIPTQPAPKPSSRSTPLSEPRSSLHFQPSASSEFTFISDNYTPCSTQIVVLSFSRSKKQVLFSEAH